MRCRKTQAVIIFPFAATPLSVTPGIGNPCRAGGSERGGSQIPRRTSRGRVNSTALALFSQPTRHQSIRDRLVRPAQPPPPNRGSRRSAPEEAQIAARLQSSEKTSAKR